MFDRRTEGSIPLSNVSHHLESRPSTATVWRWALRGVKGVKLESIVIGGRRYTSTAAIDRFITRLSEPEGRNGGVTTSVARSEKKAMAAKKAASALQE